jgi:cell cycle arrest protein BUB3
VYLYDLKEDDGSTGEGRLIKTFSHRAPVLDVCFGENDEELFSAGLDWDVRR